MKTFVRILLKFKSNKISQSNLTKRKYMLFFRKCGSTAVTLNACINSFMERKKLSLSGEKCSRIHIGNKTNKLECATLKVHNEDMKNSEKEKYLGDFLTKNANPKDTIINRKQRGHGILAKMRAILRDVPLGSQRLEIGLTLRQAWFINGTLFNSEVWCAFSESDLKVLEVLDSPTCPWSTWQIT